MTQETGFDWMNGLTGLGGGALGTFLTWFWRAARVEPKLQAEFKEGIQSSERSLRAEIDEAKRDAETKVDEMVGHFHEAFTSMRQQISNQNERIGNVQLDIEQRFIAKDAFGDFLKEYRENTKRIFDRLDSIPSGRRQK